MPFETMMRGGLRQEDDMARKKTSAAGRADRSSTAVVTSPIAVAGDPARPVRRLALPRSRWRRMRAAGAGGPPAWRPRVRHPSDRLAQSLPEAAEGRPLIQRLGHGGAIAPRVRTRESRRVGQTPPQYA